jgi:hypothetical protein
VSGKLFIHVPNSLFAVFCTSLALIFIKNSAVGWTTEVQFPTGVHLASYPMGTGGSFPERREG